MFKFIRLFCFTSLSYIVVGCATFNRVDINPVETAVQLEQRSLTDQAVLTYTQSVIGSSFSIEHPVWDLDALTVAAIHFNPDIQVAKQLQSVASAAVITANQRPNPTLTSAFTFVTHLVTNSPWIISNAVSIPIETAHKRDYRVERFTHLVEAADQRYVDAIWIVRGRLRTALLEHFVANESMLLIDQQIATQRKINQLMEQQLSVGEITPIEVTRSRLALNQLEISLSTAEKRLAESNIVLASIIGVPVEGLNGINLNLNEWFAAPALKAVQANQLKSIALHSRPDILAALADYDASQSALQLEIANQYPNVSISPGYSWDTGANKWELGASALQLPVFHQNQGPIAETEAKRKEMAERFRLLQMKVISDVDRASAGTSSILQKWNEIERQKQIQKNNMVEVEANYEGGEIDQITLLLAKLEGIVTQRAELDVLFESHQAMNSLEDTLRQPMHSVLTANLQSKVSPRKMYQ